MTCHLISPDPKEKPDHLGAKKWSDLGNTVGIMIKMFEPIFGTVNYIVPDSVFCVANRIYSLEERGVYSVALIKKRKYWPKGVPDDDIYRNFHNRDIGDVDMLDSMIEEGPEGKLFMIIVLKETEYIMKTMYSWTTLEELEGADTRRDYKGWESRSLVKLFKYWHLFVLPLWHRHHIDNHKNSRHYQT